MSQKMDRRKKYTRNVLKESLVKLLADKPLSEITVKEICTLADINRSTFYTHYRDHYDLLHKIEDEITEDMNRYLHSYSYEHEEESLQMTEKILEYIIEHKLMFETLLNIDTASTFEKRLMDLTRNFMVNNWVEDDYNMNMAESKYLSSFVISGAIHVIKEWIDQDMKESPSEMAAMINRFVSEGISYLEEK
ncbi:TetR/AcrR family transcriptional regulator [Halobacillus litoralis]|uniref:TetR/AcrR family transcriptional regulator n=1 Tax=Halobacillus litoralis TaxID=45668 RepID=UPI001CD6ADB1|nr:TetR/AcrR family transcriptional regulator [Halobacillus litoralis]MCA0970526.1 TetR/AcrR family transcriptional regulator [Halobacillus litoralis]